MRVKRYIVDTLPDAVQLIRTELGKDAVILETKDVKVGGFLGMFRTKKLEVLAAVEPNRKQEAEKKKLDKTEVDLVVEQILKASQKNKSLQASRVQEPEYRDEPKVTQGTKQQSFEEMSSSIRTIEQEPAPNLLNQTYNSNRYTTKQESQLSNNTVKVNINQQINEVSEPIRLAPQVAPAAQQNEEAKKSDKADTDFTKTEAFILKELKQLRKEMKEMAKQKDEILTESDNILALRQHLAEHEFNPEWLNTLCEFIQEVESHEERPLSIDEVWAVASKQLIEWLIPFSKASIESTTRVIQLVGPTGVGKTTTIAKLAANFTIQQNKHVGFISADTYRIAAVDQLKTYANILNLPIEVVFSASDLPKAYKGLEACELIIMDTAGRNYKSDLFVSEVNSLVANTQFSESILVVSLTSRTRDIAIVAEKFSKYGVRKVVFTKLDEAHCYGSVFNMIMQFGLQPIYVTSGQNVPDDIDQFNIEKYVMLLLGEPKNE